MRLPNVLVMNAATADQLHIKPLAGLIHHAESQLGEPAGFAIGAWRSLDAPSGAFNCRIEIAPVSPAA